MCLVVWAPVVVHEALHGTVRNQKTIQLMQVSSLGLAEQLSIHCWAGFSSLSIRLSAVWWAPANLPGLCPTSKGMNFLSVLCYICQTSADVQDTFKDLRWPLNTYLQATEFQSTDQTFIGYNGCLGQLSQDTDIQCSKLGETKPNKCFS